MVRTWFRRLRAALWALFSRSLRNRLILLTTLAVGLGATLTSVVVYQVAQRTLYSQLDEELLKIAQAEATLAAAQINSNSGFGSTEGFEVENVLLTIVRANREEVFSLKTNNDESLVIDYNEVALARLGHGSRQRNGLASNNLPYRIVAVPFIAESNSVRYALVLGRDLTPTNRTLDTLFLMQWISGLIGVAVGAAFGLLLASSMLSSIRHLNRGVAEITATDELAPVKVEGSDEVAQLALSFNSLVASLASSRERQRRLIADASHELRTPLTSLRTNVELLVADENTGMLPEGARSAILRDVAEQLGEFTALIGDLVSLSREEIPHQDRIIVDLADVLGRAVLRAQRRGPNLHFDVVAEPTLVRGDPTTLERAITNLLDNAVKFSPDQSTVTVRLSQGELRIRDQGIGIEPEDLPYIFERFYRSDRSRNTPGTGLGLSIVDQTIHSHGGVVSVRLPEEGGTEFVVHLPLATDTDEDSALSPDSPV